MPDQPPAVRRLLVVGTVAAVLVAGAVTTATAGDRAGGLLAGYDAAAEQAVAQRTAEARPHRHDDPTTKNALSRTGESGEDAQDPTTVPQKVVNAAGVAVSRRTPPPALTTASFGQPRARHPEDRYAMAGGCYRLARGGEPLTFQATDLGRYLLYDAERRFIAAGGAKAAAPGDDTVWRAVREGDRTAFTHGGERLRVAGRTAFLLTRTTDVRATRRRRST